MRRIETTGRLALTLLLLAVVSCGTTPAIAQEHPDLIRVGAVNTPSYTGLLDALIADFKSTGGKDVWVYSASDVYDKARSGDLDMVISHYGKDGCEPLVMDGLGEWPRPVFANQAALIGPEDDPAGVRGMTDAAAAFRKIAESGSPYILNNSNSFCYVTEILWQAAGKPPKGDWFVVPNVTNVSAVELAQERGGYVIYGAFPFLRYKLVADMKMDALVIGDPFLQRMMASILIRPDKTPGVNYEGAKWFQAYLLSPRAQVLARNFRVEGSDAQLWWPAGRHNSPDVIAPVDAPWNTSDPNAEHGTGGGGGGGTGRGDGSGGGGGGRGTGGGGGGRGNDRF